MGAKIGFVLLTHREPAQILRLVMRLNALYSNPPIAIHHDFSKCPLEGHAFPDNVRFVRPHIKTRWSKVSLFVAMREALRLLYSGPGAPDWFVYLSGSDYPTALPSTVLAQLESEGFDAYLDHRLITWPPAPGPQTTPGGTGHRSIEYLTFAHDNYMALRFWLPGYSLRRRMMVKLHLAWVRNPSITRWFHPFSESFPCYAGECWFSGNSRCAHALLEDSQKMRKLLKHLKRRFLGDECVEQTILCNTGLKVSRRNHRYIEWQRGQSHPKALGIDDVPSILASGAHFARKFAWPASKPALDAIDETLDRALKAELETLPARQELLASAPHRGT